MDSKTSSAAPPLPSSECFELHERRPAGVVIPSTPSARIANQRVWKPTGNDGVNSNVDNIEVKDKYGVIVRYFSDIIKGETNAKTFGKLVENASSPKLWPASFLHASMRASNPMYKKEENTGYFSIGLLYGSKVHNFHEKPIRRQPKGQQKSSAVEMVLCHATDAGSNARYGFLSEEATTNVTHSNVFFPVNRFQNDDTGKNNDDDDNHKQLKVLWTDHGKGCRTKDSYDEMCYVVPDGEPYQVPIKNRIAPSSPKYTMEQNTKTICLMDRSCRCNEQSTWGLKTSSIKKRQEQQQQDQSPNQNHTNDDGQYTYADFYIHAQESKKTKEERAQLQTLEDLVLNSCWYEPHRMDEMIDSSNSLWLQRHGWSADASTPDTYNGHNECYISSSNAHVPMSVDAFIIQLPPLDNFDDTTNDTDENDTTTTTTTSSSSVLPTDLVCRIQQDMNIVKELTSFGQKFRQKPVLFLVQTKGMIDQGGNNTNGGVTTTSSSSTTTPTNHHNNLTTTINGTANNNKNSSDTINWSFDHIIDDIYHDQMQERQQEQEQEQHRLTGNDDSPSSSTKNTTNPFCNEYWDGTDCHDGYSKYFVSIRLMFADGSCLATPKDCKDVYFFPKSVKHRDVQVEIEKEIEINDHNDNDILTDQEGSGSDNGNDNKNKTKLVKQKVMTTERETYFGPCKPVMTNHCRNQNAIQRQKEEGEREKEKKKNNKKTIEEAEEQIRRMYMKNNDGKNIKEENDGGASTTTAAAAAAATDPSTTGTSATDASTTKTTTMTKEDITTTQLYATTTSSSLPTTRTTTTTTSNSSSSASSLVILQTTTKKTMTTTSSSSSSSTYDNHNSRTTVPHDGIFAIQSFLLCFGLLFLLLLTKKSYLSKRSTTANHDKHLQRHRRRRHHHHHHHHAHQRQHQRYHQKEERDYDDNYTDDDDDEELI